METGKFYSPEEIAIRYNVKPTTIREWIRTGKLRAIKLGHLWRIPESALHEFIKDSREKK